MFCDFIKAKVIEDIESAFDDEKYVKMDLEFRINAAYLRTHGLISVILNCLIVWIIVKTKQCLLCILKM